MSRSNWFSSRRSPVSRRRNSRRTSSPAVKRRKPKTLQLEALEERRVLSANVTTDLPDYAPGATAHIFASEFAVGESVEFQVLHTDGVPNTGGGHEPWQVTDGVMGDFDGDGTMEGDLDGVADGNIHTTWYVNPDDSIASQFELSAVGLDSAMIATTTFTDAAGSNLSQFANKPITSYQNGNLGSSNSAYVEGNSVPFRYLVSKAREGGRVVLDIIYQFQATSGARTYDYLTTDTASQAITDTDRFGPDNGSKPSGFGMTSSTNLLTPSIPDDPSITTDTGGMFRVASNVPVSIVSVSAPAIGSNPDEKHIVVVIQLGNDGDANLTEEIVDLAVFWGGHLARDTDYAGTDNGASDASGSSFRMRAEGFLDLNANGTKDGGEDNLGGGDRSMQSGAVVHTSLAWEKRRADTNALQGGATFTVTANPFTGSGSLTVVDDTDGVTSAGDIDHNPLAGQFLLEDFLFGTYTITETVAPAGFNLDPDPTRVQSVTSAAPNAVVGTQDQNDAGVTDESDFHNPVTAVPVINVEKLVNGQDADAATGPLLSAGGTATFTYSVTNPGNVPLSNVSVIDDNGTSGSTGDDFSPTFTGGDTNSNNLLDLTETWTYSANRTVVAGQYTNIATASGKSPGNVTVTDTDPANYYGAAPALNIEKLVNGQDADSPTGPVLAAGGTATFTYQVTNTGNIALGSIVVVDDNGTPGSTGDDFSPTFTGGDTNSNNLLDLNETWTYSASGTVLVGQYTNIGTVTGSVAATGQTASDTDPANYYGSAPALNIEKLVNGQDADSPTGPLLSAGGSANFTYQVTNTGNIALGNVVVTDDNGTSGNTGDDFNPAFTGGDTNGNNLLDLNETWTYSASSTVLAGQYTNIGAVTGSVAATGQTASDTDPANYYGSAPGINIEKLVNGQDADSPTGPVLSAGGTATFTYEVTNTGNIALGSIVVVDDNGTPGNTGDDFNPAFTGGDTNSNNLLDLGETWTYSASGTVLAGQYTNIGAVTGSVAATGQTASDTDPANYFGSAPGINIEKLVNGQDADSPTGPILVPGTGVGFTYIITNTGNIALSINGVIDDNGTPGNTADDFGPVFQGGDTNGNDLLDVNETWTFFIVRAVVAGQHTNIGTVFGQVGATGQLVTDTDPGNYFGAAPGINIEKLVNGQDADSPTGPVLAAGSTATFTYEVTNTGNFPLSNVTVVDDNGTPGNTGDDFNPTFTGGDSNSNNLLDLDETWTYIATATIVAGQYTNLGTATGDAGTTGLSAIDTDPANYFGSAPGINIEKLVNGQDADSATGPLLSAGGTANFTYQVTNTGNIAVGSIVVVDDNGTPGSTADDFNPAFTGGDTNSNSLLDLGETWTYSATGTVVAGQYTNIGNATGSVAATGQTASDTDPANYFGSAPALNIEKLVNGQDADSATGPILAAGGTATFTYQVTNTGNIAVGSIVVVDDNGTPGSTDDDFNPAFTGGDTNSNNLLDLGETWTYSASGTVLAGQYTNIGAVTGSVAATGQTASDTDPANYFGSAPGINIEKLVNGQDADSATGPLLHVNDPVTFTYQVTNTGNVALGNVVVTDDNGTSGNTGDDFSPTFTGGDTNSNNLLDLNETWTYSATGTVVAGQYTNIGSVSGSAQVIGQSVSDTDPANYFGKVDPIIVIAPDKGNTSKPIVKVINQDTGKIISQFYAYEGKFLGGVQVATGDMTGDGIDEIITAPGQGRVGEVRVFTQDGVELTQFRVQPYGSTYKGGIEVAVGDVDGDGDNDIVTATKYGRPDIRVFYNHFDSSYPYADAIDDWADKQFYVFGNSFKGGADVVVADMGTFYNGVTYDAYTPDGRSEIIVGNGPGMQSTIHVYDVSAAPKIVDTILPLSSKFKGGITLSTARVNGDAIPDLIVAAGNGGGSALEIWSGLTSDAYDVRLAAFSTFGDQSTKNAPIHAAALDTDGDGIADIVAVVQGTNGKSNQLRYFNTYGGWEGTRYGLAGPWNIATLENVDPSLPLDSYYDVAAKDDVYTLIGTTNKPAKKKKK